MSRQNITPVMAVAMADALRVGSRTYDELVAISGLKKPTVARWIKAVREPEVRAVRIEGWRPDKTGRAFVAAFRWDSGADAARPGPAPDSAAQRMREMRARRKAGK